MSNVCDDRSLADNRDSDKANHDTKSLPQEHYQIREFIYHENGEQHMKNNKGSEVVIAVNDMPETDDCAQTKLPKETNKENTPDLLQNDYKSVSQLQTTTTKLNGSVNHCNQDSNYSDYSSNDARGHTHNDRPSVIPPAPAAARTIKIASRNDETCPHTQLHACHNSKTNVIQALGTTQENLQIAT